MPKHERPYTDATVKMQPAGEGHVVLTLYATKRQVADLAWQLRQKVVHPPTYPSGTVHGEFREYFKEVIAEIASDGEVVEILAEYPG